MSGIYLNGGVNGPPKRMKTSSALAFFGPSAICSGDPVRIRETAMEEYGFEPAVWPDIDFVKPIPKAIAEPIRDLPMLLAVLEWLPKAGSHPYMTFFQDDISLICRTSVASWEDEGKLTQNNKVDKYYPYTQLTKLMARVTPQTRQQGLNFWYTAHDIEPSTVDGKVKKGGPDFGSSGQVARVTAWMSTVVRATMLANDEWPDPWGATAGGIADWRDADWVSNDSRGGFSAIPTPLNLREVYRQVRAPVVLPRLGGLEWQDEAADLVADRIDEMGPECFDLAHMDELKDEIWQTCLDREFIVDGDAVDEVWVRQAFQDGMARWVLTRRRRKMFGQRQPGVGSATEPVKKKGAAGLKKGLGTK